MTNKKLFRSLNLLWLAVVLSWTAGCAPAGPRALLQGKRLLEEGEYAPAVEKLKLATSLLRTNAQAWNYFGLALHHAGQPDAARDAYRQALKLDHDLVSVHYNLGCLLLEQNKPDAARDELTAFTLHQGNSVDGRLKLGAAQMRLGELAAAERTFNEALRLSPQNPEALNNLGVIRMQQRRPREAAPYFNSALKQQPDFGPALLNLAVMLQSSPNDRPQALQKYREYLALKPRPANWEAVNAAAQQLDLELNPPPVLARVAPTNPVPVAVVVTNVSRPATNLPARPAAVAAVAVSPPSPPPVAVVTPPRPVTPTEVVQLPEPPVVRAAGDGAGGAPPASRPVRAAEVPSSEPDAVSPTSPATSEKKGFFQRLNPANIFRSSKPEPQLTPLPPVVEAQPDAPRQVAMNSASEPAVRTAAPPRERSAPARYAYRSPARPAAGNRMEAQARFAAGYEAQRDHRVEEAVAAYRAATQADPSFFEAQSNLGLAAYDAGNLPLSLSAYETALAITPGSFNARYNFALALRKANYVIDAAEECERLLLMNASETPAHLAAVHLMLAGLYAEQFHQPPDARPHYQKVLELDPQNANATAIRYWLRDNP